MEATQFWTFTKPMKLQSQQLRFEAFQLLKETNAKFFTFQHLTNLFKYINHSLVQLRESSKEHSSALLFEALKLSNEIATDVRFCILEI